MRPRKVGSFTCAVAAAAAMAAVNMNKIYEEVDAATVTVRLTSRGRRVHSLNDSHG